MVLLPKENLELDLNESRLEIRISDGRRSMIGPGDAKEADLGGNRRQVLRAVEIADLGRLEYKGKPLTVLAWCS